MPAIDTSFKEIASEFGPVIYTFALYTVGCREDAEDVTQEVLLRLWRRGKDVAPNRRKAWLLRVTRNVCVDMFRKRARERRDEGGRMHEDLRDVIERRDMQEQLQAAIAKLREPYRTVVILRGVQGMSYEEIGQSLDMPVGRVKVYLHRGRRFLRRMLSKEEEEYVETA